jgi:hypothetical protein
MNASDDGPEDVRYDSETGTYSSRFEYTESDEPTRTVVDLLATAMGQRPQEMDPLWSFVDTDALNRLFADQADEVDHSGRVSFTVDDWRVTVYSGGEVLVDRLQG